MRILNLSVLVCVGGVLAALPFRHSENASQELLHPARATGPTIWADDPLAIAHPYLADLAVQRVGAREAKPAVPLEDLIAFDAPQPEPRIAPRRPLDLPATYEELAVPVIPSPLLQDRFSATVDAEAAKPAPAMDPSPERAPADWETNRGRFAAGTIDEEPDGSTTINLISAPLPKADRPLDATPSRERHWIRQP